MDIVCDQGRWLDSAVRNVPRGTLRWSGVPRRVYTAAIGTDCVLATVRRAAHQAQWVVSMPGFIWDVAGERGSTTTRALSIVKSPSIAFRTSTEARRAVERAYQALREAVVTD
jgi:hypothetical protein